MRSRIKILVWSSFALLMLSLALSPDDLVIHWLGKTPAPAPQVKTIEEGLLFQAAFVKKLEPIAGKRIGYKVGLTSKPVQQKFGVSHPLRGVLLKRMLLESGASVAAKFGAVPIVEADLLVRVKDSGVNQATSPAEVIKHLDAIIPFIELPDLVLQKGQPLNGATITAINVGARLGVVGKPIAVEPTARFAEGLAEMRVLVSVDGKQVMKVPGKAILGNPLNAVVWLAQDLAKHGQQLQAGDIISLGSFGKPFHPQAGSSFAVKYEFAGKSGNVMVSFR